MTDRCEGNGNTALAGLDDDVFRVSDEEPSRMAREDAELYALAWGFDSAAELKEWGRQAVREGQAGQSAPST